jgi:internalin A
LTLYHLRSINLSDNLISQLPSRISDLRDLSVLVLRNNKLESLPSSLALLPRLTKLIVDGNPLRSPPKEIVKRGFKEVIGYLRDLSNGSEPCFKTKLMGKFCRCRCCCCCSKILLFLLNGSDLFQN